MRHPRTAGIAQIATTSLCWPSVEHEGKTHPTSCSNCTRLLQHEKQRYIMTPEQFETAVLAIKGFAQQRDCGRDGRRNRVVGIFGGEPLLSPHFPTYVDILCEHLPAKNRGLWTSLDWRAYENKKYGRALPHVLKLFGRFPKPHEPWQTGESFLNWNMHEVDQRCEHQPLATSADMMVKDKKRRWELIEDCWVQREWSPAIALDANNEVKFYFCEVASAWDRVLNLGTGLPATPDCWKGDLWFEKDAEGVPVPKGPYASQILSTCGRCGAALPWGQHGRLDREWRDDVTPDNRIALELVGSPMIKRGHYVEWDESKIAQWKEDPDGWSPEKYIKQKSPTSTK